jgi:Putative beta-barrel porin-2, OmpL-like. bbp2
MKKLILLLLSISYASLSFPKTLTGDEKTTAKTSEAAKQKTDDKEEKKEKIVFSGYLDTYYLSNLNSPASRSNLGVSGFERAFDQKAGQFSLGLVQTKVQYTNEKSEVVIDLTFGPNANLGNYGNAIGTALAIKQAYFNYKFSDKFTFTAGQFGTHIGYEVIDAPVNYHYSLSNLFTNGPFYHIGAKGTYAFSDKASLMVGLVNNVDNLNDNNRKKGLISQLFLVPMKGWNVYLNAIYSNEANEDDKAVVADASYGMLDLTTSYQITDKFLLGLNAAYGSQKGEFQGSTAPDPTKAATWGGAAVYTNYAINDVFGLGARYEYFDNTSGVRALTSATGLGTSVSSLTLTGNFTLADGHVLIKPEFRMDSYLKQTGKEEQQFLDDKGASTQNAQSTLGLSFIYKF